VQKLISSLTSKLPAWQQSLANSNRAGHAVLAGDRCHIHLNVIGSFDNDDENNVTLFTMTPVSL